MVVKLRPVDPYRDPAAPAGPGAMAAIAGGGENMSNLATLAGLITCPECQRASPQDRKFCPGCGHALWEPCVKCGTLCAAGERFCGSCGTNLQSSLEQESGKVQSQLAQARDLFAHGHYAESQRILRALTKLENKRLAHLAEEAGRLAEQFRGEWTIRETTSVDSHAEAQAALETHRYDRAIELLESVTATLRTAAMNQLLDAARLCKQEIGTLTREIQVGLATQRHLEVLPKAERLLTLQPENESVRTLIAKIGQKLVKTAADHLARHRYDEAVQLLEQVPASGRDETFAKLHSEAAERLFLTTSLRQMPFCDKLLVGIVERLAKHAPEDEGTQRIQERMRQVLAAHAKRERPLAPPSWAKPPEKTPFDAPVDPLFGFRRLAGRDEMSLGGEAFVKHAAQFYVAAGLALQGLDKSGVKLNLATPDEQEGFLASLGGFLGQENKITGAWGLDLSGYGLKAIKLSEDEATGDVLIEAVEYIRPPLDAPRPSNESEARSFKQNLLREFHARRQPRPTDRICVGLPGSKILGRFIELPPIAPDKIADAVRYEAVHQIPFPLEQLDWGYHVLGDGTRSSAADEPVRVLLVAAKQFHAREHRALFTEAGLTPHVLQSECVALHNLIVFDRLELDEFEDNSAVLTVDVGSDAANFVVSTLHDLFFRSINAGGNDLTAGLIRNFKLTYEQAEQVKRNPALAKRISKVYELFDPSFAEIADEIRRTMGAYAAGPIRQIYGVGGGFQVPGLLRHLRLKG